MYDLYTIFINPSKKDSKLGYFFGKTGLGIFIVAGLLPIINLFTIWVFAGNRAQANRKKQNAKASKHSTIR